MMDETTVADGFRQIAESRRLIRASRALSDAGRDQIVKSEEAVAEARRVLESATER